MISIVVHSAIEESTENSAQEMQGHVGGIQRQKESMREKEAWLFRSAGQSLQLTGDFDKHVRRGLGGQIQAPRFVGILSEAVSVGQSLMPSNRRSVMVARSQ